MLKNNPLNMQNCEVSDGLAKIPFCKNCTNHSEVLSSVHINNDTLNKNTLCFAEVVDISLV